MLLPKEWKIEVNKRTNRINTSVYFFFFGVSGISSRLISHVSHFSCFGSFFAMSITGDAGGEVVFKIFEAKIL